jgi:glucose/mannose transport system substrate-binding protein
MFEISRRHLLAGIASTMVMPTRVFAENAQPKLTLATFQIAGSDGQATKALTSLFEKAGGTVEIQGVPGAMPELMGKIRSAMLAGQLPAVSSLKGPDIQDWANLAETASISTSLKATGMDKLLPKELANLYTHNGEWIALPMQVNRVNTLFVSKKAIEKIGGAEFPKTWEEFNALASKMEAAGIVPLANGGLGWDDFMKFEVALSGISVDAYRRGLMQLDPDTLKGQEVLAAFEQFRKIANWCDKSNSGQRYAVYTSRLIEGQMGMSLMGGWLQGVIKQSGFSPDDYLVGPAPTKAGQQTPFIISADSYIFWKQTDQALIDGQSLFAQLASSREGQSAFTKITGGIPARTDVDLSSTDWTDLQRESLQSLASAAQSGNVLLSCAFNMAYTGNKTQALADALAEFAQTRTMSPADGQSLLVQTVSQL